MSITRAPWVSPAIPSPSRRTSIDWRHAARASTRPTATRRSACPRAPRLRRAATCTSLAPGTTPSPTTAAFPAGGTRCSAAGTASIPSASCTTATPRTPPDSTTSTIRCTSTAGMAWSGARCATARPISPIGPMSCSIRSGQARRSTTSTTTASPARRRPGSRVRRAKARTGLGSCSWASLLRTFR